MTRSLYFAVLLATASACPPPVQCPGGPTYPVVVELSDGGDPFTDEAAVTYVHDGLDPRDCPNDTDLGANAYGCGTNRTGDYEVTVVVSGREDVSESVTVGQDECRLAGEVVSVEIGELCQETTAPSVHVLVEDATNSDPLKDAIVKYRLASNGGGMQTCEDADEEHGRNCGDNEAGDIRVSVLLASYTGVERLVNVQMGTCTVETEELLVQLEPVN